MTTGRRGFFFDRLNPQFGFFFLPRIENTRLTTGLNIIGPVADGAAERRAETAQHIDNAIAHAGSHAVPPVINFFCNMKRVTLFTAPHNKGVSYAY